MKFFSRPARRRPSRITRGSRLRLECLDARDCPAAPVLVSTIVSWMSDGWVRVYGSVQDENPAGAVVQLTGGAQANLAVTANGQFSYMTYNVTSGISLRATDTEGLASATQTMPRVTMGDQGPPPPPDGGNVGLRITNIQITNSNGHWQISGTVENAPPGTVIRIDSSNPAWNGRNITVENPDGGFQIGISPGNGDPGGSIGIRAETPDGIESNPEIRVID